MDGQPSRASNKSDLDKPVDDDEEEDIEENDKNRESESDVRLVTLNCFVLGDFILFHFSYQEIKEAEPAAAPVEQPSEGAKKRKPRKD